jgi:shikimate kinase
MAKCEKILIAGFSGAGKSSLLRELRVTAPDQEWTFDDLDQLILKSKKVQDIAGLIQIHGWEKFRLWERQTLEGWLKEEGKSVLALGGGALSQMVFNLFRPSRRIRFCYLHAPFEDCWERLHLEGSEKRPLLLKGKEGLFQIYRERQIIYQQIDWVIQNPQGTDLQEVAAEFWEKLTLS